MQPETKRSSARTEEESIGFYCRPDITRLIVALDDGRQGTAGLPGVVGDAGKGAKEALEQLHYRWIVDRDENGYLLTNNGILLAIRIRDLCGLLHRAHHDREEGDIPPMPELFDAVLDDLAGITEPAAIKALRDPASAAGETKARLIEKGYCVAEGGRTSLSKRGREILESLERYIRTVDVIERFNAFFQIHSFEGVPASALTTIDDLICGELICDVPVNFRQGLEYFHEVIREAQWLHGVSTWFLPAVAETIWERVTAGAEVELVITPELAVPLWQEEIVKKGRDPAAFPNLKFYVCTVPVKVGLTVTDNALSLGLFLRDGKTYDRIHDLLCFTPEAVGWGERLFEYYRERSIPIEKYFSGPNRPTASCR